MCLYAQQQLFGTLSLIWNVRSGVPVSLQKTQFASKNKSLNFKEKNSFALFIVVIQII